MTLISTSLTKLLWVIILLQLKTLIISNAQSKGKTTVSGYVKEKHTKETLPAVIISVSNEKLNVQTNNFGFYSFTTAARDSVEIFFRSSGYRSLILKIPLSEKIIVDVEMESEIEIMDEVVVEREKEPGFRQFDLGKISIPVAQMKNTPSLLGEKDMLKVLQLMPGVQKGREGNSGLYVRGGGPDQNLILLDDAIMYNAFHLFGFYSLFNGDALKSIELTKGGFPARYGGRLSSVVEMHMKEGSKESIHVEASLGLIASKMTVEGPIIKNKSSFLISARRTYLDLLVTPLLPEDKSGLYYFYDINTKLNYDFGGKNKIYISSYLGSDKFSGTNKEDRSLWKANLGWGNITATSRWNHLFSDKLFSNTSLIFSKYKLNGTEVN